MNKMILRRFTLLVALVPLAVFAGCEIAVDFDRTKIPTNDAAIDSSQPDTSVQDTGIDTSVPDASDAGSDASDDAASDADADANPI